MAIVIKENDFILTQIDNYCNKFDVEVLYTVKPKNKEPREEFKNIAYGVTIPYALKLIVHYRINKEHTDKNLIVTMREYIKLYELTFNKLYKDIMNYNSQESECVIAIKESRKTIKTEENNDVDDEE